ncbi:MAG: ADOP family duplicated permease [Vicinamibacterales bacterium]
MRLYRALLRLLPRGFRLTREADLVALARESLDAARGAGALARLRVGAALARDVVRQAVRLRAGRFARGLAQDLRVAFRRLRRSPLRSTVTVLSLGIGLALNTTVFSLVNAFYLRPSEFPDPARLVTIFEASATQLCAGCSVGTSAPGYLDWRDGTRAFERLEASEETAVVVSAPLTPERVSAARVTPGLFAALGIAPRLGRDFAEADASPGATAVALIGDRLWRRGFGGDPGVVGRDLRVNGGPVRIVGVLPPDFAFPSVAEIWLPYRPDPAGDRSDRSVGVIGRLRRGVSIEAARAEVRALAAAQVREHPETQAEWTADVVRLADARTGEEGRVFLIMLGAVALVLLVTCANIAALALGVSAERARELALRSALGGGRLRLMRLPVLEALVAGVAGGALGLLGAAWGISLARIRISEPVPYYIRFTIDWRVVVFCVVAAVAAAVLVGLLTGWHATRGDLVGVLKTGGRGGGRGSGRIRAGLLAAELAVVVVLLACAGLLARSVVRLADDAGGYDRRGLTLATLPLAGDRYEDPAWVRDRVAELRDRLRTLPGTTTALSATVFLAGFGATDQLVRIEGAPTPPQASPRFAFAVTPGFFEAQGLRLLAGRAFDDRDTPSAEPVAIVNAWMAEHLWGGAPVVGRRVRLRPADPDDPWRRVVGVVSDLDGDRRGRGGRSYAYVPFDQGPARPLQLLARTVPDQAPPVAAIREALAAVDPDEPLSDVRSADEDRARSVWFAGYFAMFYAAFAGFGLALAVVGVFGVAAQVVGERMREFGIRIALGADPARLSRVVLRSSGGVALAGILAGLAGARLAAPLLGSLLFGADPVDPIALGGAGVVLFVTVLVASAWPARRAARADPAVILRAD